MVNSCLLVLRLQGVLAPLPCCHASLTVLQFPQEWLWSLSLLGTVPEPSAVLGHILRSRLFSPVQVSPNVHLHKAGEQMHEVAHSSYLPALGHRKEILKALYQGNDIYYSTFWVWGHSYNERENAKDMSEGEAIVNSRLSWDFRTWLHILFTGIMATFPVTSVSSWITLLITLASWVYELNFSYFYSLLWSHRYKYYVYLVI